MSTANESLAAEIAAYLHSHPDGDDTVDGIAEWWIRRHRVSGARAEAELLLNELVRGGTVETYRRPDGRTGYRPSTRHTTRR